MITPATLPLGITNKTDAGETANRISDEIRALLDRSQNHLAFERGNIWLRAHPTEGLANVVIAYLTALAAARGGALEIAADQIAQLRRLAIADKSLAANVESLAGRLAKDTYVEAVEPAAKAAALDQAIAAYLRADELSANAHARINAATLLAIRGRHGNDSASSEKSRALAASVEKDITHGDHWAEATLGEAAALLGKPGEALSHYGNAHRLADARFGDIASMRRQLQLLSGAIPGMGRLLAAVPGPTVIVFSGHMIDKPLRNQRRFPAEIETAVREEMRRTLSGMLPVIGYSQAACGGDLLFCELLLELGQELNIVLPFARDDYVTLSVAPGGADWRARFERVCAEATSLTYATEERYLGDDCLFEHVSNLIQGLAFLRARTLAVAPLMLAVADPSQPGAIGGTLATLANWQAHKQAYRLIDLKVIRDAAHLPALDLQVVAPASASVPTAAGRQIKFLLFADIKGFSRLPEEHFPAFFVTFLGMVPKILADCAIQPLEMSTRGDGLYMVFADADAAARFAWQLSQRVGAIDWPGLGLPDDTHVRVALHAGPVFVATDPVTGNLAHYGTHVTRAARIEPIVAPGQILVSEPFAAVLAAQANSSYACDLVGVEALAKGYADARLYRLRLS